MKKGSYFLLKSRANARVVSRRNARTRAREYEKKLLSGEIIPLQKKSCYEVAEQICDRIKAEVYTTSAWGDAGHPVAFISPKNPSRSFVTWTTDYSMPQGYARYYVAEYATEHEAMALGL